ncbi:hypothetical protein KGD82_16200 [Nocardiopsis eucommiae]|uniref:Uncharacterized protein n=1 Tax=Nocardiopsis eucommiae TaxID=2831970 RepID=A0A975LD29_9ACTN|nr:hypothetical protein KGD82_16200 [Nocardiopsis eucommiae]
MVNVHDNLPCEPEPGATPPKIVLYADHARDVQIDFVNTGDEFLQHDKIALAKLSEAERREQENARALLWRHVLTYWEQGKANGWNPASRPEWESVAGMLDFVQALTAAAQDSLSGESGPLSLTVEEEDGVWVARSTEPELASQGSTRSAALRAFAEALELLEEEAV